MRKIFLLMALCLTTIFAAMAGEKQIYYEYKSDTRTLTYYYDDQMASRTGETELYNPKNAHFYAYFDDIKKAVIASSMKDAPLISTSRMFMEMPSLQTIEGLKYLNTANVQDMSYMFLRCKSLISIDLSSFSTNNVLDMSNMFNGCQALYSLDFSTFNTSNVMNMSQMFYNCKTLTSLDLRFFNIANVTDMTMMFEGCSNMATISCNGDWSTSSAASASMFKDCSKLVGGNSTTYNELYTDKVYARPDGKNGKKGYFTALPEEVYTEYKDGTLTYYCDALRTIRSGKTETYDPVNEPNKLRFGEYCENVKKAVIDPSMKDTLLTSLRWMFYGGYDSNKGERYYLTELEKIEGLQYLNTENVTNMRSMFDNCSALTSLDLSTFKTANVKEMNYMFFKCTSLKELDLHRFDISNVTDMEYMFSGCSALKTIYCNDYWSKNTKIAHSTGMFNNCTNLKGGNSTPQESGHTDKSYAHPDEGTSNPGYFTTIEVKKEVYTEFDEPTATLTYYCDESRSLRQGITEPYDPVNNPYKTRFSGYVTKIKAAEIAPSMKDTLLTSMQRMFAGGLTELIKIEGLTNLNTVNVKNMSEMFNNCPKLVSLNLSSFNTEKVTDMSGMFYNCEKLSFLNISSFNTAHTTNMSYMFYGCKAQTSIQLNESFNTANVTNMLGMFALCSSLTSLDLCLFNIDKVTNMNGMFYNCTQLKTIYCNGDWSTSTTLTNSGNMFYGCSNLVGGKGTTCNGVNYLEATYARPDGGTFSDKGYFTKKTTTGIETVTNDQSPITNKIIKDNQILILRDGKTYTIEGQLAR